MRCFVDTVTLLVRATRISRGSRSLLSSAASRSESSRIGGGSKNLCAKPYIYYCYSSFTSQNILMF